MSKRTTRRRLLQVAGSGGLAGLAGCLSGTESDTVPDGRASIRVRIENVAPTDFYPSDAATGGGLWLTPGAYVTQKGHAQVVTDGEPASDGVEALAEAGLPSGFEGQQGLVDEMANVSGSVGWGTFGANDTVEDPNDPTGSVPGAPVIAPGGAFEFDIEIREGRFLVFASKVLPTNDIFIAPKDKKWIEPWPWGGSAPYEGDLTEQLALWDAGTEPNQQPGFGADQPPSQNSTMQGADEGGVVRPLSEVDDGYDYPAVDDIIKLTVAPL